MKSSSVFSNPRAESSAKAGFTTALFGNPQFVSGATGLAEAIANALCSSAAPGCGDGTHSCGISMYCDIGITKHAGLELEFLNAVLHDVADADQSSEPA
jgi:hypothetical protein